MPPLLSVDEALARVLQHAHPATPRRVPRDASLGLILAETVASDVDSPPWDKSVVDGYAVRAGDVTQLPCALEIIEEVMAGAVPALTVGPGQATQIMTGAPIPAGCDAVVMVERTRAEPAAAGSLGRVVVVEGLPTAGQNILRQGCAMRTGDEVLAPGSELRPGEIGLLAEVGRADVLVHPRPTVAILSTGNELVAPETKPRPGQIRNSNGPMLAALARSVGATPVELGVARDERAALHEAVAAGLKEDLLVLSGGVSAGVLDLVPQVLAELGVREVFHKVRVKPGKPLWFGVLGEGADARLVFGLPGNPVSSYVCFELFVRPAIQRRLGRSQVGLKTQRARLATAHFSRGGRPTYHPADVRLEPDGLTVRPVSWKGSADLRALSQANGLVHFPAEGRTFEPGEMLDVLLPG